MNIKGIIENKIVASRLLNPRINNTINAINAKARIEEDMYKYI